MWVMILLRRIKAKIPLLSVKGKVKMVCVQTIRIVGYAGLNI